MRKLLTAIAATVLLSTAAFAQEEISAERQVELNTLAARLFVVAKEVHAVQVEMQTITADERDYVVTQFRTLCETEMGEGE